VGSFKNHTARKAEIYTKAFLYVYTNHGPRGSDGPTMGKTIFTSVYIGKNLLKSSSPELAGQFQSKFDKTHPCIKFVLMNDRILFKGR
jgi:hypothetical protein